MTTQLFRQQAVDAQVQQALGGVIEGPAPGTRAVIAFFVCCALALVGFAVWGEYARKVRVSGYIVAGEGVAKLYATQGGQVVGVRVREGDQVVADQVLLEIDSDAVTRSGPAAAAAERLMEQRSTLLPDERRRTLEAQALMRRAAAQRLASLQSQHANLLDHLRLQEERLASIADTVAAQQSLVAAGFVSRQSLAQRRQEQLAAQAEREGLRRSASVLAGELEQARLEQSALDARHANERGVIDRSLAALAQERVFNEARRGLVVRAPLSGRVTGIVAHAGQQVASGAALLSVLPEGADLRAEAYLPSRAVAFVGPDTPVRLQLRAFPYQKFGSRHGRVASISRSGVPAAELPQPAFAGAGDLFYLVSIELHQQSVPAFGREHALQAGMAFDANLVLEPRSILEWIFEPVLAAKARAA